MQGIDIICLGLLIALLLPICLTDLREQRIPNSLNLGVAALGLAHALAREFTLRVLLMTLLQALLAGALFIGTMLLVRVLNKSARIGWGDLKFLVAASFWVGVDGSVFVLLLACLAYVGFALAIAPWRGLDMKQMRPFGPMLAFGMLVMVVVIFLHGRSAIG